MELTINNLIKLIIGLVVFIAVVAGFYIIFKTKVIGLFEGLGGNESAKFILSIMK